MRRSRLGPRALQLPFPCASQPKAKSRKPTAPPCLGHWLAPSALILLLSAAALAQAPLIRRVAPPDWWQTGRRQSLRLLITGRHLRGVRAQVTPASFQARDMRASANGHYLLLTLAWQGRPAPAARITLSGPGGRAQTLFRFAAAPVHQPQGFGPDQVIYLVMVDRFARGRGPDPTISGALQPAAARGYHGGDFLGIRQHLDYFRRLGVGAIWLTPIYDNGPPQDYHGYSAINEYRVENHFGNLASLRALVAAAHRRGLRVIQDQVANHTGPENPWVRDPPEPDWFHGSVSDPPVASFDYAPLADPYASPAMRRAVTDGWFAGILPDLNQSNPDVARFDIQNSLWWLGETGMDGIREDTFPMVPCRFWRRWDRALQRAFPRVRMVGEVFDHRPWVTAYFERDCTAPAGAAAAAANDPLTVFDYPLYFAIRKVFAQGGTFAAIAQVLAQDRLYRHPDRLVTFLGDHDVPRFLTAAGGPAPAAVRKLQLAFAFLLTMRGEPMIYYGDEIGMTGGKDPNNRHNFPGGFPGSRPDAFTAAGRTPEQNQIWSTVHRLLRLRAQSPPLRHGQLRLLLVAQHQFAFWRRVGGQAALVIFNTAQHPALVRLPAGSWSRRSWRPALAIGAPLAPIGSGGSILMPPMSARIFSGAAAR